MGCIKKKCVENCFANQNSSLNNIFIATNLCVNECVDMHVGNVIKHKEENEHNPITWKEVQLF